MGDLSVVMVSASFHPYVGGAERQALELSAALRGRRVRVRVLTRRRHGLPAWDVVRGVPVERLWCAGGGVFNSLTFLFSLWFWLLRRAKEYTVIHVHLAGSPALAATLAGRLLGKKVVVKLGGGKGIGELAVSAGTWMGRLKLKMLAWLKPEFVVVTKDLVAECEKYLGPVCVSHRPNGVDTEKYRPVDGEQKRAARQRLGWPSGLGFLYAGRLSWEKQLPVFLRAWCELAVDKDCFVAFVGDGPKRQELEDLRAKSALAERIFIRASMTDVAEVYAAADVFVLPSVSEGLSNALLEAMASGLAVLGSRVGGTAEAVAEGREGLLFAPEDGAEMREKLGRFLAEPGLAARMGAAAREKAVKEFDMACVAKGYEELYEA